MQFGHTTQIYTLFKFTSIYKLGVVIASEILATVTKITFKNMRSIKLNAMRTSDGNTSR